MKFPTFNVFFWFFELIFEYISRIDFRTQKIILKFSSNSNEINAQKQDKNYAKILVAV